MEYRTFMPDLELRAKGDGRTIFGISVPWAVPRRIDARLTEQWAQGAFNAQLSPAHLQQRVRFAYEHVDLGGTLVGGTKLLRNDAAGLYGEWSVARTKEGDDLLALFEAGALRDLSIGFNEGQNRRLPGGVTERVTARLFEVALTLQGAYGEHATAAGVRAHSGVVDTTTPNLERARLLAAELPELPPAV